MWKLSIQMLWTEGIGRLDECMCSILIGYQVSLLRSFDSL
jgi:hypothetical protein